MNRSKKPGRPSKQTLAKSSIVQVKPRPNVPQSVAVTSVSDAFVGFHSKVSPSKPMPEVFMPQCWLLIINLCQMINLP